MIFQRDAKILWPSANDRRMMRNSVGGEQMQSRWKQSLAASSCLAILVILGAAASTGSLMADEWRRPVLEVFVRADSERSQAAREFVEKTYAERPGLSIVIRDVVASEKALDRLWKLADHFKNPQPQLPAFYVCGQFESGWNAATTPVRLDEVLTVEVFTRQGCPRCAEAKPILFGTLAKRYPGFRFVERDVETTEQARQRLSELSQRYRVQATSVPAVHMCGRLMVGFVDATTTHRQWDDVLRSVTVAVPKGEPAPRPVSSTLSPRQSLVIGFNWFATPLMAEETPAAPSDQESEGPPPPQTNQDSDDGPIERPPQRRLPPETPEDTELLPVPTTPHQLTPEVIHLPWLGSIRWRDWGFPAFTVIVGLIDGFNPCAMWVLLFLLSMLVNMHDRWKILVVAGTFVLISGAAYYAFMAAWLSVFEFIGLLRPAQIILGVIGMAVGAIHVKDFFAFKRGISLSIPETAKPGIYARVRQIVAAKSLWGALAGASIVAVLVNIVELLCTAGLPAMYTGILSARQLPWWQDHLYMMLYIAAYMFDDALMVTAVVITLDRYKLQERGGRILKLISGLVILALGSLMLFKPEWLV